MVKYYAQVDGNEYEVTIERDQLLVDGQPINVDLKQGGVTELYSMLFDGASYELLMESERSTYAVTLLGEQFQVLVEDEYTRKLNMGRKAPALPTGDLSVSAPIPGLVVKVLVAEGDTVEENQPLVILEAMKMENEICSLRSGTVKSLNAEPGQRVEQNEVLIVLE